MILHGLYKFGSNRSRGSNGLGVNVGINSTAGRIDHTQMDKHLKLDNELADIAWEIHNFCQWPHAGKVREMWCCHNYRGAYWQNSCCLRSFADGNASYMYWIFIVFIHPLIARILTAVAAVFTRCILIPIWINTNREPANNTIIIRFVDFVLKFLIELSPFCWRKQCQHRRFILYASYFVVSVL